jgi:hypothetical protein
MLPPIRSHTLKSAACSDEYAASPAKCHPAAGDRPFNRAQREPIGFSRLGHTMDIC